MRWRSTKRTQQMAESTSSPDCFVIRSRNQYTGEREKKNRSNLTDVCWPWRLALLLTGFIFFSWFKCIAQPYWQSCPATDGYPFRLATVWWAADSKQQKKKRKEKKKVDNLYFAGQTVMTSQQCVLWRHKAPPAFDLGPSPISIASFPFGICRRLYTCGHLLQQ